MINTFCLVAMLLATNGNGFAIQRADHPRPNAEPQQVQACWKFYSIPNKKSKHVLVRWTAGPFEHERKRGKKEISDTGLFLRVLKSNPAHCCQIVQSQDQTNVQTGRKKALVSAVYRGYGSGLVELNVRLINDFASEGEHCAIVKMTITRP